MPSPAPRRIAARNAFVLSYQLKVIPTTLSTVSAPAHDGGQNDGAAEGGAHPHPRYGLQFVGDAATAADPMWPLLELEVDSP